MRMKRKPYQTYPQAFTLEALHRMEESDRPASKIAMPLGIRRNQLYKWKERLRKKAEVPCAKRGRPKKQYQSETATLGQEVKRLREENGILKKAAAGTIIQCIQRRRSWANLSRNSR